MEQLQEKHIVSARVHRYFITSLSQLRLIMAAQRQRTRALVIYTHTRIDAHNAHYHEENIVCK